MNGNLRTLLSQTAILAVFGIAGAQATRAEAQDAPASAQGAQPASSPQSSANEPASPTALGEIVVTAQRQSQNIQKVPISVTAITPQVFASLGIRQIDKIDIVTPGLTFTSGYDSPQAYIRGIGAQSVTAGLENPVAFYIDGAYIARGYGSLLDVVDPASVEVLKGPQGTLYGRNATGGAVLIKTADPTSSLADQGVLEYGRFNHILAEDVVNLPVDDTLAIRLAGRIDRSDGFYYNEDRGRHYGNYGSKTIRGKIRWSPDTHFSAIITGEYSESRNTREQDRLLSPDHCLACVLFGSSGPTGGFYSTNADAVGPGASKNRSVNMRLNYDAGQFSISSTTAYRYVLAHSGSDQDLTDAPAFQYDSHFGGKTFTQDAQIASHFGGLVDFLAGAQYVHDLPEAHAQLSGLAFGFPELDPNAPRTDQYLHDNAYAAFVEAYVKPINRLTITLGGRYSTETKRIRTFVNPAAIAVVGAGPNPVFSDHGSYHRFTPRAVVAYDAGVANFYASYTRGFRSGGFNTPSFAPSVARVRNETITSYEIGTKLVSPDRRARMNIAAFRYDYRDLQVTTVDSATGGNFTSNAASARGQGVEADFSVKPVTWLTLSGGGEYLDAKYRSFPDAPIYVATAGGFGYHEISVDLSGTRMPHAPKWSGYLSSDLAIPLNDKYQISLNGVVHYTSSFDFFPDASGNGDRQRHYALANATLGLGPLSDSWKIELYSDNLTNRKYYDIVATGQFGQAGYAALPRTYGVRLKWKI